MTAPQFTPEQRTALADAIYSGRKIEAIKELRAASGLGLKEAKDIVDRLEVELRTAQPERFPKAGKSRLSWKLILIFVLVDAVILYIIFRR